MRERVEKLALLNGDFDVLIIGGGATGLGIAVDAVTRGYRTALVEAGDFAQGTSSRSTKLVHGGVRYFASGQIHLVHEALHERKLMVQNAPHLVRPMAFVTPAYKWRDLPYYGAGLKLYNLLSGSASLGPTQILSARETLNRIPGLSMKGLKGSVLYHDGQFDDARFALALARTADDNGALALNYVRCTELLKVGGRASGAVLCDMETGNTFRLRAKVVFNATGIFVDSIRSMDDATSSQMLTASRGTHIVVDQGVLGNGNAIMVPKTRDGRVIFAIPWLGRVLIGTTDIPVERPLLEPGYDGAEIDFLIETINPYLEVPIHRSDITSVFSGLRPLVRGNGGVTSTLSREHAIELSASGVVTVAGGKWTTYRRMAEDALDFAIKKGLLPPLTCVSSSFKLRGAVPFTDPLEPFARYGSDALQIQSLIRSDPQLEMQLDTSLPLTLGEVVYGVREEMARTLEDVLARRTRTLFLDTRATLRVAPIVARAIAKELGQNAVWVEQQLEVFERLVREFYEVHDIDSRGSPQ